MIAVGPLFPKQEDMEKHKTVFLASCVDTSAPDQGDPIAFDALSSSTASLSVPANNRELKRMEDHLASRYVEKDVRHRFRTISGDEYDCVDFNRQPGVIAIGVSSFLT
jgi:hypothetical protein